MINPGEDVAGEVGNIYFLKSYRYSLHLWFYGLIWTSQNLFYLRYFPNIRQPSLNLFGHICINAVKLTFRQMERNLKLFYIYLFLSIKAALLPFLNHFSLSQCLQVLLSRDHSLCMGIKVFLSILFVVI